MSDALDTIYANIIEDVQQHMCVESSFLQLLQEMRGRSYRNACGEYISCLTVFTKPRIISIYRLLKYRDCVFEELKFQNVSPAMFMLAAAEYVFKVGTLNTEDLFDIYDKYGKISDKAIYNLTVDILQELLMVFYD